MNPRMKRQIMRQKYIRDKKQTYSSSKGILSALKRSASVLTGALLSATPTQAHHTPEHSAADPFDKDCVLQPIMLLNTQSGNVVHAAFSYCKSFFSVKGIFPEAIATIFNNQVCAPPCTHNVSVAYDANCCAGGWDYQNQSWPFYSTHVISESINCNINGTGFSIPTMTAECFDDLTQLAGRTLKNLQEADESSTLGTPAIIAGTTIAAALLIAMGRLGYDIYKTAKEKQDEAAKHRFGSGYGTTASEGETIELISRPASNV